VVSIGKGNAVEVFSGAAVLRYPTCMDDGRGAEKQKGKGAGEHGRVEEKEAWGDSLQAFYLQKYI